MKPADKYFNEYSPFISRDDEGRVLLHIVTLPDELTGFELCAMSQRLKDSVPRKDLLYYHLVSDNKWVDAARAFRNQDDLSKIVTTGKESFPHQTDMHLWTTEEGARNIIRLGCEKARNIPLKEFETTEDRHFILDHWLNTKGCPDQKDHIFWTDVSPKSVVAKQLFLASIAKEADPDCIITTPLGEQFKKPHFTLLGCEQHMEYVAVSERKTLTINNGMVCFGFSRGNGQFGCAAAVLTGRKNGPTKPDMAIKNMEAFLAMK